MLQPVIIAGGSGTRLWPLSRKLYPKPFLPLTGEKTMLQITVERLAGLEHLPPISVSGRNTAPAICLAALLANKI